MEESVLSRWESFYVIVGSSAAALTGLMFVVIALIAESHRRRSLGEINAFGTPMIVHFSVVLLVSALLSAPWHGLLGPAILVAVCGTVGVVYGAIVIRRTRLQGGYHLVLEDWIWHIVLPILAYLDFLVSGIVLRRYPAPALFAIGGAGLLLLVIGIHNAWDTVTYIAIDQASSDQAETTT